MPAGYSLFTVTFKNADGSDFDMQSVRVLKNGTELSTSAEVTLQGMTTGGAYDTTQFYNWRTRSGKTGWHSGSKYCTGLTNAPAAAWCIYNKTGDSVVFRLSGGVELTPASNVIPVGYGLFGNMTPNTIDIQDILVYSGDVLNPDTALVTFQGMTAAGAYDSAQFYNWRTRSGKTGWHIGSKYISAANGNDVLIAPGEAFCLNNKTTGPITLKFKSPVSTAE